MKENWSGLKKTVRALIEEEALGMITKGVCSLSLENKMYRICANVNHAVMCKKTFFFYLPCMQLGIQSEYGFTSLM